MGIKGRGERREEGRTCRLVLKGEGGKERGGPGTEGYVVRGARMEWVGGGERKHGPGM